jgi:hypothetical protein
VELLSLIEIALWDQAQWAGVVYATDDVHPPIFALAFRNGAMGHEIFRRWRALLGDVDRAELLRIAIVENDLPGEPPDSF